MTGVHHVDSPPTIATAISTSPSAARAGSRRRSRSSSSGRTARASRSCRDVPNPTSLAFDREGRLYVEPVRRQRLPRRGRTAARRCMRPISASPAASRSVRTARSSSAIDPARSCASSDGHAPAFACCRRASPRSISRSGPTATSTSPRDARHARPRLSRLAGRRGDAVHAGFGARRAWPSTPRPSVCRRRARRLQRPVPDPPRRRAPN